MSQETYLSPHFSFYEMYHSDKADELGIDNTPSAALAKRLEELVLNVLEPLRELWGAPIVVTSGYRCPALNKAVGGSSTSQHRTAEAADIRTKSDKREDNMALLKCLLGSGIVFDQIIAENVDKNGFPDWIHVSYTTRRANRHKRTTMKRDKNGKSVYYNGINL